MIKNSSRRSRFAPSPSGIIHIGNLRSALMSFLCAKEEGGSFILRIEDTDQTRTQDYFLQIIYKILDTMKLYPDEGPLQGGKYGPYIQSQRKQQYDNYLSLFLQKNLIYRCFKTPEELEIIKNKQIALKLPPKYERTILSAEEESKYLSENKPFVWRFKLPHEITIIQDKVKGEIKYNLIHFSDCPITRDDLSYTFLFANFVDDVSMNINYIVRGEEHLSNTAIQSCMYDVLNIPKPLFYHLPLICDGNGKKLSKRNFGFNIEDLLGEGYLPEAIINYIAIVGSNFKSEIMSLQEMIDNKIFSKTKSTGFITYDAEKLLWINMKWMQKIDTETFIKHLIEYKKNNITIDTVIPENKNLIDDIKKESKTIKDFFFHINSIMNDQLIITMDRNAETYIMYLRDIILEEKNDFIDYLFLKNKIKEFALKNTIEEKKLYNILRVLLINKQEGISIGVLLKYIDKKTILNKINTINFL
jgi:glutamyl-tRNA synthetase